MKKIAFILTILALSAVAYAIERPPQFRVWKSSDLDTSNYSNVLLSSEPIIFHMVAGSGTVNFGGNSYFAFHRSSGTLFTTDSTTKAYIPLDSTQGLNTGIGIPWDVYCSSHCFYTKQGGSKIQILWDYFGTPPNYTTGGDSQSGNRNP